MPSLAFLFEPSIIPKGFIFIFEFLFKDRLLIISITNKSALSTAFFKRDIDVVGIILSFVLLILYSLFPVFNSILLFCNLLFKGLLSIFILLITEELLFFEISF